MRNQSVKNNDGENVSKTSQTQEDMPRVSHSLVDRQTVNDPIHSQWKKASGKTGGTRRRLFYRDENDGWDYIL